MKKTHFKPRYWLFAPSEQARLWTEFYKNNMMGIGWEDIGSLNEFDNKNVIKSALMKHYHYENPYHIARILWQFAHSIKTGDIIYAKLGYSKILGRGVVESDYIFDNSRLECKHIRKVKWTHQGEWEFMGQAPQKTLNDITSFKDVVNYLEHSIFNSHHKNQIISLENSHLEDSSLVGSLNESLDNSINESLNDSINDSLNDSINGSLNGFLDDSLNESTPYEMMHNIPVVEYEIYQEQHFLNEVFMNAKQYHIIRGLLERKKNVILKGAPGVGKTFIAKRLAFSMMGEQDHSRVHIVQFHQSYSYEDFVMGYRPKGSDFSLEYGVFYEFCQKAKDDKRDHFFIIDEINRGNLSRIFGELLMLMESDKRGESNAIGLLYTEEPFFIPSNVYLIGTMNTADRSLAMIDYALRRRFAFFDIEPAFSSDGFKAYQAAKNNSFFDALLLVIEDLNQAIVSDPSLGKGFCIGHSYFCLSDGLSDTSIQAQLADIINYEIIPLLEEYWFDEESNVTLWSKRLRRVFDGSN